MNLAIPCFRLFATSYYPDKNDGQSLNKLEPSIVGLQFVSLYWINQASHICTGIRGSFPYEEAGRHVLSEIEIRITALLYVDIFRTTRAMQNMRL